MTLSTSLKLAQDKVKFSSNNTVCLKFWLSVSRLTSSLTSYTLVLVLEVVRNIFFSLTFQNSTPRPYFFGSTDLIYVI